MTGTIELADLDRALATAAPHLDPTGQRVAVGTYRRLAAGQPVPPQDIAGEAGLDTTTVRRLLDSWGAVFRDDQGRVIGFWGLAIAEMPHRLRLGATDLYAWCAWDPLFLAHIIGPLEVASNDPETGEEITYRLDGDGHIHDLSHPQSVLSFLRPDRPWSGDVVASFCHYVLHFTNPGSAEQWTARHDGTLVLDRADAVELARRHVARTFPAAI